MNFTAGKLIMAKFLLFVADSRMLNLTSWY